MHSVCYNYSPSSFNDSFKKRDVNPNYNLRNRAIFATPTVRIEMFKKFPLYTFPITWNLSGDISFQTNKITFQIALKNLLNSDCYEAQQNHPPPPHFL